MLGHRGSSIVLITLELAQIREDVIVHLSPPQQIHHIPLKEVCNSKQLIIMSKKEKDISKWFIKHLLGHWGSYKDLIERELDQKRDDWFGNLPPPHQIHHVLLIKYEILYNKYKEMNRKKIPQRTHKHLLGQRGSCKDFFDWDIAGSN